MDKKKFIIMMIGKTHSGKNTFAEKLENLIENSVVIQTDLIASFLSNNYKDKLNPPLRTRFKN